MAPKIKITKERIIEAAVEIVRKNGESGLNSRSIAAYLGCSTQPVFSNFESMEELRACVIKAAEEISAARMKAESEKGEFPPYKAAGIGYIDFASEEPELFRLLYMSDRGGSTSDMLSSVKNSMGSIVTEHTGLSGDDAVIFHVEIWAFVHGIAVMSATSFFKPERQLVSSMLTDVFQGLKSRHGGK